MVADYMNTSKKSFLICQKCTYMNHGRAIKDIFLVFFCPEQQQNDSKFLEQNRGWSTKKMVWLD